MNHVIDNLIRKLFSVEKFSDLGKDEKKLLTDMFCDGKFNEKERLQYWKILYEDEKLIAKKPDFTDEEIGYRRGYSHGVYHALLGRVTNEDVREWIISGRLTGAPGTFLEKSKLSGLTKEEIKPVFHQFIPE